MSRPNRETQDTKKHPKSVKVFGNVMYWIAFICGTLALFLPIWILAQPENNVLNPHIIFEAIFNGATLDEIWSHSVTGAFPGAHFSFTYITKADSWASLFINLICGVGLLGLIPAMVYQIKEKDWFCLVLSFIIATLIFLSMIGLLSIA